jgi:hypothetical protein
METEQNRVLRCLIEGASAPIKLSVSVKEDVDDLKERIYDKARHTLRDVDIIDLTLWKVRRFHLRVRHNG